MKRWLPAWDNAYGNSVVNSPTVHNSAACARDARCASNTTPSNINGATKYDMLNASLRNASRTVANANGSRWASPMMSRRIWAIRVGNCGMNTANTPACSISQPRSRRGSRHVMAIPQTAIAVSTKLENHAV